MSSTIEITNDPVLTNIYNDYMPPDTSFVRPSVLPVQDISSESADIISLGTKASESIQVHPDYVAGRAGTPEIEVSIEKGSSYTTKRHALKIAVTKDIGKAFDTSSWRAGMDKAERVFTKMLKKATMVSREKGLADQIFTASNFGVNNKVTLSGSDQWSDYANSDIVGDTNTAFQAINDAVGLIPNAALINLQTFLTMRHNPGIKHTIAVASNGAQNNRALTQQEVALALGVDKLLVANCKYETAAKGATSVKAQIWDKKLLFFYTNPNPQPEIFEESFGYTFLMDAAVIDTYSPEDPKHVKFVRSDEEYADYIMNFTAGYLISDVIA